MRHIVLLLSLWISASTFAQQTLTPENLWKLKRISGESISPDGSKLLYTVRAYQLEKDAGKTMLVVMNPDGTGAKNIEVESIFDVQWRPDGKKIGYLSAKKWFGSIVGNEPGWNGRCAGHGF